MNSRIAMLVKKDFILLKYNLYTGLALAVFIPVIMGFSLVSLKLGVNATITAYLSGVIYTTFILYFYLALEEAKYNKSIVLLNAIYTKKEIVTARYLFFLLMILICTTIFLPLAFFLRNWFLGFTLNLLIVSLSLALIITSLFIPFTYIWSIDVAKYVLSGFLLGLSFGGVYISKPFVDVINASSHPQFLIILLFVLSIVGCFISKYISVKCFRAT
jgi:hypothetical protein